MVEIYLTKQIKKELEDLSNENHARVIKEIELLEEYGYKLGKPHVKYIGEKIYELRAVGNPQIRLFFTYLKKNIVIFDFYIKKSQKIPRYILERISKRVKKWKT